MGVLTVGVDLKFSAQPDARAVIALTINTAPVACILPIRGPRDNKAATNQVSYRGIVLVISCLGVNLKLIADFVARTIVALTIDAVTRSILIK